MIDNTMPERIYTQRGSAMDVLGNNLPYLNEEVEYVRADLVAGNANEPLASGQYRWVKHYDWPYWELGQVVQQNAESASLEVVLEDIIVDIECLQKIGPVIRPPEGK